MLKFLEGLRSNQAEVWLALEYAALSHQPVRVEVENSLERFVSHLAVSNGTVMLSRPPRPTLDLSPGSFVRARLPGDEPRELRLQVVVSRMATRSGGTAFLCRPSRRQLPTRRMTDRYSVRRYSNLRLALGDQRLRVLDVSLTGCKVFLNPLQGQIVLPIGQEIHSADLNVGSRITMQLDRLIPRSHTERTVGCEFEVSRDGTSDQYLARLIASLDKKEKDRRINGI